MLKLQHYLKPWQQPVHRAIEGLSRSRSCLAHDPCRLLKIGVPQFLFLRQWVGWSTEDHQFILEPLSDLQVGVGQFSFYEGNIELEIGDLVDNLGGVSYLKCDLGSGLFTHEARH